MTNLLNSVDLVKSLNQQFPLKEWRASIEAIEEAILMTDLDDHILGPDQDFFDMETLQIHWGALTHLRKFFNGIRSSKLCPSTLYDYLPIEGWIYEINEFEKFLKASSPPIKPKILRKHLQILLGLKSFFQQMELIEKY